MVDPAVPLRVLYVDRLDEGASPVPALERDGQLDVTLVETASDGLARLDEGFDCIVCGAELPDEDGLAFCRQVNEAVETPVVIVGAKSAARGGDDALEAGAVDYMPRSLLVASPTLFSARLRRIVDRNVDPARPSPLDVLPVPTLLGDDRIHYANEAARTALANGEDLVGRSFEDVFELDETPQAGETVEARIAGSETGVTLRTVTLPESSLRLTVVFTAAVAAREDERLLQRANMLDSILEHIPLSVYFKDRHGRHVAVSDYLPQMNPDGKIINPEGKVHHTTDDILGKTDFDLYPSELAEQTTEDEQEIVETEEPIINKTEYTYTPDQELMRLSTSKAPWYGPSGEVLGIVGITVNITDEKRYENTVDYQQHVLGLIQTVLDEPVAGSIDEIRGIVEDRSADEDDEELLTAARAVDEHVDVVDTLLQEGQQQFGTELIDIEQLARRSWERIETGDATLTVTYNGIIRADPAKVEQLFDELFENAIAHGGPEVSVTVEQFEDGFFVADDGPGIPPGERRHVFEYGYSTQEDAIGSGLPIAETIAGSLDWELTIVESADGGCRIEVTGVTFE